MAASALDAHEIVRAKVSDPRVSGMSQPDTEALSAKMCSVSGTPIAKGIPHLPRFFDLIAATGWQVHSVRAALTGLRKETQEPAARPDFLFGFQRDSQSGDVPGY